MNMMSAPVNLPTGIRAIPLRTLRERIRQGIAYELVGCLIMTPAFAYLSHEAIPSTATLLLLLAMIALVWNGLLGAALDGLEARLAGRSADRRPMGLRVLHAALLEAGVMVVSLPALLWWTDLSAWQALSADLGLSVAYAGYAFVFNQVYDKLFPPSASSIHTDEGGLLPPECCVT
ncbi:PACE efflux transporter [Methylolobus aquaticus]